MCGKSVLEQTVSLIESFSKLWQSEALIANALICTLSSYKPHFHIGSEDFPCHFSFSSLFFIVKSTSSKSLAFLNLSWHLFPKGYELTHLFITSDFIQPMGYARGRLVRLGCLAILYLKDSHMGKGSCQLQSFAAEFSIFLLPSWDLGHWGHGSSEFSNSFLSKCLLELLYPCSSGNRVPFSFLLKSFPSLLVCPKLRHALPSSTAVGFSHKTQPQPIRILFQEFLGILGKEESSFKFVATKDYATPYLLRVI